MLSFGWKIYIHYKGPCNTPCSWNWYVLLAILKAIKLALTKCIAMSIISVITITMLAFWEPTVKMAKISGIVESAFYILTALTTVLSTIFMCRRIKSSITKTQHSHWYQKIIQFSIESSAIYSVASILSAIYNITGITSSDFLASFGFNQYASSFTFVMTVSVV